MLRTLETGIKGGSFFDEAGLFNLTTGSVGFFVCGRGFLLVNN
jgi:hypothetical protein